MWKSNFDLGRENATLNWKASIGLNTPRRVGIKEVLISEGSSEEKRSYAGGRGEGKCDAVRWHPQGAALGDSPSSPTGATDWEVAEPQFAEARVPSHGDHGEASI